MKNITLNNGVEMPQLGYGVYQVSPEECERCVCEAFSAGYRSIDTAQAYYNEEGVGNAWKKSGISRDELFLTTKIWVSNAGMEKGSISIDTSLKKLQTDYIDLLLIHQPFGDYYGTYRAMEQALKNGKVRAIGVSNFYPDRFIDLAEHMNIIPAVNQIETHVFNQQINAHKILDEYNTKIESWGPFAEGRNDFFNNKVLREIGEKYNKSVGQVALRYLLEREVILIPKSSKLERMRENMDIFDFSLSEADKTEILALDQEKSLFFSHQDPETVRFILSYEKNNTQK